MSKNKFPLLAATNNAHKLAEFRNIFEGLGIEFHSPQDIGGIPEVEETGTSFEENSALKSVSAARFANSLYDEKWIAFADDSGLVVEALDDAPGIFSARYATTNEKRIERVLAELENALSADKTKTRKAKFVCVVTIADENRAIKTFRGEIHGVIGAVAKGVFGFGYDPIFYPDGFDRSFAELGPEIKDRISHRAVALAMAADFLNPASETSPLRNPHGKDGTTR